MKFEPLALAILLAPASMPAGLAADDEAALELDPVVVVASKTPRPMSEVVGQVSVVDAREIESRLIEDLDDLLRYEPGLGAESSGTRFGMHGVNIRGIGGNRVAIEVDGMPLRDRFAIGSYSDGGRALVETDRVKRLEVLYGPASTLYGSDALGGVMAFTTWDPADLTGRAASNAYYGLRVAHRGADASSALSATAARQVGPTGLLFSATLRDGRELDNQARPGTARDGQSWDSADYLLRATHDTPRGHRWRLTAGEFRRDTRTGIHSILGFERFRSTTALTGDDHDEHRRLGLDYEFAGAFIDSGVLRAYNTRARTEQVSFEERAAARTPVRLRRKFTYETDSSGLELNLFRNVSRGGTEHRLGAGIEWLRTDSAELRDGFQQNIADGSTRKTVLGEALPVRDFPVSTTDELGIFVQDEISLGDGRWAVIPALRYDRYDLEPKPDAIFVEDNPVIRTVAVREDEISPRLGILYSLDREWSIYGQYVRGFRAPPFEDANIGLDIPLFNIRAIPNPGLKSETSDGFEFGIRHHGAGRRFSLALFHTEYDEFIETKARIGVDPESGVLLFQSRNIDQARIHGLDLRFDQDLAEWSERLRRWRLKLAASWARGENRDSGAPLNSVSPPQAILGLAWSSNDGRWNAGLTGTFTARQDEIDLSGGDRFEPPGYGVLDLTAAYRHADWLQLRAGIFNLGDKRYWRWADVSGLDADDPMLELLTRPGRSISLSAKLEW